MERRDAAGGWWLLPLVLLASCAAPTAPPATGAFQVVALGDSYASGQGAPDRPFNWFRFWEPVGWADRRCNRSHHAPAAQAVTLLDQQGRSVALQSFACSGASIEEGLLESHMGPEPNPGDLPLLPQIEALKAFAQSHHVEAVAIIAGGNDIYFEHVVLACLALECKVTKPLVDHRLAQLPTLLNAMAAKLDEVPNLDPASVLLVEYPNPARGANGDHCNHAPPGDALARIDRENARWAGECVVPWLNHEICMAAQRHGFRYVGDVSPRFHEHGYCAQPQNRINSINDSIARQNHYRGGMHPNPAGHQEIGEQLAEVLSEMIDGQAPPAPAGCPPKPTPATCSLLPEP